MKKCLVVIAILIYSSVTCKSYKHDIKAREESQIAFEKKADRVVSEDDLETAKAKAAYIVKTYKEKDITVLFDENETEPLISAQEVRDMAQHIEGSGEIMHLYCKINAECLFKQANKDSGYETSYDYCQAYMYAFLKEVYQEMQDKIDQEK